jgi:hypothetical protein
MSDPLCYGCGSMNKQRNQFAALSEQDRKHVLDLCTKYSYKQAAEILGRPRSEGGLAIVTSRSALNRFFTTYHEEPARALLAQYASAVNVRSQQDSNAFLGAIRASVEARVLEGLKNGKALADMERDFRLLKTAQTLYLNDAKWRVENPKAARAAYQEHVDRCAKAPDIDFIPIEEASAPAADREALTLLTETSEFELDILKSRHKQQVEAEQRKQLLSKLRAAGIGPEHLPDDPEPQNPPKSPAIPHFPPNPTKTDIPEPAAKIKPLPGTPATSSKIGRNAPCPCGSGKKNKKCCLNAAEKLAPLKAAA